MINRDENMDMNQAFNESKIDILVLQADLPLDNDDIRSLIDGQQRKLLYLEEEVQIYIVLTIATTVATSEVAQFAKRASLTIDVITGEESKLATSQSMARQDSNTGRDSELGQNIYCKTIEAFTRIYHDAQKGVHWIVWQHTCPLIYAKTKAAYNQVSFNVSITLMEDIESTLENEYIEEHQRSHNLLHALAHDRYLAKEPPVLMSLAVSSTSARASGVRRSRKSARRTFSCTPALSVQLRSLPLPNVDRLILSVDIATSTKIDRPIWLQSVDLQIAHAKYHPLGLFTYPYKVNPEDATTFAFDVEPDRRHHASTCPAVVVLKYRPEISGRGSGPLVTSKWNVSLRLRELVSVQSPTNPRKSLQSRNSNPAPSRSITRPDSGLSQSTRPTSASHSLTGVLVILDCPRVVRLGDTFALEVTLINESTAQKTIAIEVSRAPRKKALPDLPESEAVAMHQSQETEAVALMGSVRLASLAIGAIHRTVLPFLLLQCGIVALPEIRIVDISTGHFQEIKTVPEIVVLDA